MQYIPGTAMKLRALSGNCMSAQEAAKFTIFCRNLQTFLNQIDTALARKGFQVFNKANACGASKRSQGAREGR